MWNHILIFMEKGRLSGGQHFPSPAPVTQRPSQAISLLRSPNVCLRCRPLNYTCECSSKSMLRFRHRRISNDIFRPSCSSKVLHVLYLFVRFHLLIAEFLNREVGNSRSRPINKRITENDTGKNCADQIIQKLPRSPRFDRERNTVEWQMSVLASTYITVAIAITYSSSRITSAYNESRRLPGFRFPFLLVSIKSITFQILKMVMRSFAVPFWLRKGKFNNS